MKFPTRWHQLRPRSIKPMRARRMVAAGMVSLLTATPALAQATSANGDLSVLAGQMLISAFSVITAVTAILHLTGRGRWLKEQARLSDALAAERARADRLQMFLAAERQISVVWSGDAEAPEIEGDTTILSDRPQARKVLAFGTWLGAAQAQSVERLVDALRQRGEFFHVTVQTQHQRYIDLEGRALGGHAVMRLREVSGDRLELTQMRERHNKALAEIENGRAFLEALPDAVWQRGDDGRIVWVNSAYVKAVDAASAEVVLRDDIELLDAASRDIAARARGKSEIWRSECTALHHGERRKLAVIDVPVSGGSVATCRDLSEINRIRADLERQMQAHERTLDHLTTAVAIFDIGKRLVFHNAAYRRLWGLDQRFLSQMPTDGEILDSLHAAHKLEERADFRSWKRDFLSHYQSTEITNTTWLLPDARAIEVAIFPNPQGGVTYLMDNVTRQQDLEVRNFGLLRTQEETLNSLREGVAVFGTDGRLKLHNPAFAELWKMEAAASPELRESHIEQLATMCRPLLPDDGFWSEVAGQVAGLHDRREAERRMVERTDGSFLDVSMTPLHEGATLMTFSDMTAAIKFERALTERNQALVESQALRNDFVHHVSFSLRSPLNTIMGFTEVLGEASVGTLSAKQREYVGYISNASTSLLAIIDDMLDLATIDMERMELSLAPVNVAALLQSVADYLSDTLLGNNIHLNRVVLDDVGTMVADGKRLRQMLFKLVSNAIAFSAPGQSIGLAAVRRDDRIIFTVSDQGRGMAPEALAKVFDRFHSDLTTSQHRGIGLGLSIVRAFAELHGGTVTVQSVLGQGTVVTCSLPARSSAMAKPGPAFAAKLQANRS